mgnify:CR=1 FL=1
MINIETLPLYIFLAGLIAIFISGLIIYFFDIRKDRKLKNVKDATLNYKVKK